MRRQLLVLAAIFVSGCVPRRQFEEMKLELARKDGLLQDAERAHRNSLKKLQQRDELIKDLQAEYKVAMEARESSQVAYRNAVRELERVDRERTEALAQASDLPINAQTGGLMLENRLMFEPGKAELREEGKQKLAELASTITREYAGASIKVSGHTDSDPIVHSSWEDNWQLSAERARVVLRFLVDSGISAEKTYLAGYAAALPYSDRKEENRRVEIVIESEPMTPGG